MLVSETIFDSFPDSILLHIFSFLNGPDLCRSAQVCYRWRNVAYDDSLYRDLVRTVYKVKVKNGLAKNKENWRSEYKRLYYHCPTECSEVLTEHTDEVLHISFSHNGQLFSTTSKDCSVKVWEVGYPTQLKYDYNFSEKYFWNFTQFSCFNSDDSKLLVSSVQSSAIDRRGYVAIMSIKNNFELLKIVHMDPSQLFGAWLDIETFLGGSLNINLGNQGALVTVHIEAFNSSKDVEDNTTVAFEGHDDDDGQVLFTFCSRTASLIKFLTVVKNPNLPCIITTNPSTDEPVPKYSKCDIPTHNQNCSNCDKSFSICDCKHNSVADANPKGSNSNSNNCCAEADASYCDSRLIYVTGEFAVALHQIGVKFIPKDILQQTFSKETSIDDGDMVMKLQNQEIELQPHRKPDSSDQMIDLNGHVTGLCLSDDKRYLYVNCRKWVGKVDREDHWSTPVLSQDIEIRVIDLYDLSDTGIRYTGHKGLSPSTMCCFVFLHTSDDYVGSGSEDCRAYLWDKHYRCLLSTYEHGEGVVNAVAFSPVDQEYLVTVSDDHTIKIWRSKYNMSKLPESRSAEAS